MIRRFLVLALLMAALAPGTWLRTRLPPPDLQSGVEITQLDDVPAKLGPFEVLGAWQMASQHDLFGSYSGLTATAPGRYLAVSDKGDGMRFAVRGNAVQIDPLFVFNVEDKFGEKRASDIEALTRDPETGDIWAAYEIINVIERRDADLANPARVKPAAMSDWLRNSGPEAMVRLSDGRFIVIGEGTRAWSDERLPAVLWNEDPVLDREPVSFAFRAPGDFHPTDIAALPDGRVLILVRRVVIGLPPRFEAGLVLADPADIAAGKTWSGRMLATFSAPFPTDNYEGLAVEADPQSASGYPVTLTIISDDNDIAYQRTLLAQLRWDGTVPAASGSNP